MKRLLLIILFSFLFAQEETLEKLKIDLRTKSLLIGLFEERPEDIELFITADSTYVVEAHYPHKKEVKRLSFEEFRELLKEKPEKIVILENTRVQYIIGQTLLGLSVYDWSLPLAIGGDNAYDSKPFQALALFSPFIWTAYTYGFSKGKNISGGSACGSFLGGIEGAFHGGFLFKSVRGIFPVSVAENLTNFYLGQNYGFTPGMFQRKFNYSCYGYYQYFIIRNLINSDFDMDGDDLRYSSVLSLAEGYTGLVLSRKCNYLTYGDALFELRTAIIGAQTAPLITWSIEMLNNDNPIRKEIYLYGSLAGFATGYLLGNKLSRDNDLSPSGSFLTYLIPGLAHGLTGGLVVLINDAEVTKTYPIVFCITEIGLTYFAYKNLAEKATETSHLEHGNLNFYFNPIGLVLKDKTDCRLPLLGLSYRF